MNENTLGPTMELCWKFYKTKKEANESEDGEDEVGWGRHLQVVCRPVTDAKVPGRDSEFEGPGDVIAFFSKIRTAVSQ